MYIIDKIKNILKKEERIPCIIWDGKTMSYRDLTQKQIFEIENDKKYSNWSVTIDKKRISN